MSGWFKSYSEMEQVHAKCIDKLAIILCLFIFIQTSQSINLGLIAGDLKRSGAPLVVRKVSHHSPVIINVDSGLPTLPGIATLPPTPNLKLSKHPTLPSKLCITKLASLPPKPFPKLPAKPPPSFFKSSKVKRSPLSHLPLLRSPLLLPPIIPPVIPHLPLLPIVPPILPPIVPPILPPMVPPILPLMRPPLLGAPRLPILSPFHPIRLPILGKTPLEKTLGTIKLPLTDKAIKRKILHDLLDLKVKGSLTTPEYLRFRKLLVY